MKITATQASRQAATQAARKAEEWVARKAESIAARKAAWSARKAAWAARDHARRSAKDPVAAAAWEEAARAADAADAARVAAQVRAADAAVAADAAEDAARKAASRAHLREGAYDLSSSDAIGEDNDAPAETFKTYKSVVVYLLAGSVRMKEFKNKRVDVVADLLKVDGEKLKYGDEVLGSGFEACTAVNADRVPVALVVGSDSSNGQARGLDAIRKLAIADESDEDDF